MNPRGLSPAQIKDRIFTIRGLQVMIDSDLAELYQVELKRLNEQVKRNEDRFPERFRFQLTLEEYSNLSSYGYRADKNASDLRSQIATSSGHGGRRYLPYVFTEQGVSMLSAVLRSKTAVAVSIQIMDTFVQMRQFIANKADLFQRLEEIEQRQWKFKVEADQQFEHIFKALEAPAPIPDQGIFFNGQMYDAYTFVAELIRRAKKSLIVIDNYIDDSVLTLLSKRGEGVAATLYTKSANKQLRLDLAKHNSQYPAIALIEFKEAHDRFIILDDSELYHFGASLKDLGKKWFAFSKMEMSARLITDKLPPSPEP